MKRNFIFLLLLISGCSTIKNLPPDVQNVRVKLNYACREVDTFENKFIFAFIPDTAVVDIWFTKQEQQNILSKADSIYFFSLPDSLPKEQDGIIYRPYCYPAYLRIITEDRDNTVFFFRGTTNDYQDQHNSIIELANLILEIAFNKKAYKDYGKKNNYFYFDYFDDL